ncbi:MAG: RNA polymerase sigma factor [Planctomycetaceae bacterium]|nr:RNA polymerase sigma factor [Planctomycetaceae bacterium]
MAALVDQFAGQVFGLCYRMLGNRQDAEDVAQETFVRVFRSLPQFDRERDFRPWLLAIAGNRCRSWLSSRRRVPLPTDLVDDLEDEAAEVQGIRALTEEVALALGGLREEYRTAFLLFHQHELSYAEISATMDCPVGTVKTWIHRARQELARQLRARGVVEESPHEV